MTTTRCGLVSQRGSCNPVDKNAEGIKLLLIFCALQFAFAAFALVYAFTSGLALLVGVIAGRIARDSLMQPMRGAMDRSSEVRDC